MEGHYDASQCLSPATKKLYLAIRKVIGKYPQADKPYIWNDDEQFLDEHIAKIAANIASGGEIVEAVSELLPDFTSY